MKPEQALTLILEAHTTAAYRGAFSGFPDELHGQLQQAVGVLTRAKFAAASAPAGKPGSQPAETDCGCPPAEAAKAVPEPAPKE